MIIYTQQLPIERPLKVVWACKVPPGWRIIGKFNLFVLKLYIYVGIRNLVKRKGFSGLSYVFLRAAG
jgi:hypothetical protein